MRRENIRMNAILPGAIDTPMLWNNPDIKSGAEVVSPHDVGKLEQIATEMAVLGSDDGGVMTGASLVVGGGWLAKL